MPMKRKSLTILAGIVVLSLLFPFRAGADDKKQEILRQRLGNGMRVVLLEDHAAPVTAFQVWVEVGSADEHREEAGISHLIEHMFFKGTTTRKPGEIAGSIEGYGGHINASTSSEHTIYHVEIASRYQEQGLSVLADAIQHPRFDAQELAREKEVVIEEIKMREDDPDSTLHQALFKNSFQHHPYGRPIIGYADTVRGVSRKGIVDYYKTWYTPRNMVFVGVGDFRAPELLARLQALFTSVSRPVPVRQRPPEPAQGAFRPFVLEKEVKERYFSLGFHIPGIRDEDTYALDLLAACLGQGDSSLLQQELRLKRGLVSSIYAYAFTPRDPGLFVIGGAFQLGKIQQGTQTIIAAIARIKKEGVTEAELRTARVMVETAFTYDRETVEGEAGKLGYFETIMGDARKERQYLAGISQVRAAQVQEAAKKYLRLENLTLCLLVPAETVEQTDPRTLAALVTGLQVTAPPDREAGGLKKAVLENGITLLFKEDHSVPVVGIAGVFLGGVRFEQEHQTGITRFLTEMMTRGTASYSALQLVQEVDSIGASLETFSGRNSFGVQAKGLSKDFPQLIRLMAEVVTTPSFPPQEVERVRGEILAAQGQERDNMVARTMRLLRETLYERHPYRLNVLGQEETIGSIGRRDLIKYYKRYALPQNMVVAVVGDISWEETFASTRASLAGMRRGPFSPPPIPQESQGIETRGMKKREEIAREKEQAHLVLGFLGVALQDQDRFPLEVLEAALGGQGGRFFTQLRDQAGLAYVTAFFVRADLDPGYLGAYLATSPSKVEQALQGMERILREVREQGVSQVELDRAKAYLIGNYEINHQAPLAMASAMAFDERYGLGGDFYQRYPHQIEQVTTKDVLRVARKYIALDSATRVIIRPATP
jgi:zinc protease